MYEKLEFIYMMQNLRYCRQRTEALADKQCRFLAVYQVGLKHIV